MMQGAKEAKKEGGVCGPRCDVNIDKRAPGKISVATKTAEKAMSWVEEVVLLICLASFYMSYNFHPSPLPPSVAKTKMSCLAAGHCNLIKRFWRCLKKYGNTQ